MAAEGCCACVKYVLFIFNFIFFLVGLGTTGVGIYSVVHTKGDFAVVIDNREGTFGAFLITVGVLSCFLSAAGCLGAVRENRCALLFYAVALSVVFVLEATGAGVGYHYRHKLQSIVDKGMIKTLNAYDKEQESRSLEQSWNRVQSQLHCCGVDSPSDWFNKDSKWSNGSVPLPGIPRQYPNSCCANPQLKKCSNTTKEFGFYDDGCLPKVFNSVKSVWTALAGAAIAIAVIQIFGITCACGLQHNIKRNDYRLV